MSMLIEEAHRLESMEGVESITVAAGFPWSNIPEAGMSFIVTTNDDQGLADTLAGELHDMAWNMRRDFLETPTPIGEALRYVARAENGTIVLADIGDNPGFDEPKTYRVRFQEH